MTAGHPPHDAPRDFASAISVPPSSATECRWLVVGAGGTLGREVTARLTVRGADTVALGRAELDISDTRAVERAVAEHRPRVVVNCAAWTAVDDAESQEAAAARINADGPRHLARACAASGARLLHVSTDYVFGGAPQDLGTPYGELASPAPHTAYGRTKLAGEQAALAELPHASTVVRTAWLYGRAATGTATTGFVGTMARIALQEDRTVDVVDDQHGQPTWAGDLAERLIELGGLPLERSTGIFHGTGGGHTTWYALAREVFQLVGADPERVRRIGSDQLVRAARRPAWSVLGHDGWAKAGLPPLRHWRAALTEALTDATGRAADPKTPVAEAR
ncbi:dTDP-4-dehydrorhamnose reductase [Streptomyces silvisoli]|uniref:dTDP-4-dehydrorhamnose reductase n=1 Tax=Streptomyces silvisoli TaxID=3034235 RepID=A0ABT5ZNR7_9ACTN|nr:dTDP-4-dehydrorhamnose reductase [Streptomyces silvisoli]MDF3291306.1 dTDP-4-dehydrorhamnose reductase [Streptomyces silvisoli]